VGNLLDRCTPEHEEQKRKEKKTVYFMGVPKRMW
jgi:hypothetical protein